MIFSLEKNEKAMQGYTSHGSQWQELRRCKHNKRLHLEKTLTVFPMGTNAMRMMTMMMAVEFLITHLVSPLNYLSNLTVKLWSIASHDFPL
ncbi:hypothetical protein EIZ39_11585 [Ammoniphilus sp. CFH 90114]|nr:hypothetical protein EIZ39_11585 [Ammoniphilus sp. CFH 90114]